jgi:arginase
VTIVWVPYHLDEYLPDLDLPLRAQTAVITDLPPGDVWGRLGALCGRVAGVIAEAARSGTYPVVVSGDCLTALGTVAGLQRAGLDPGIIWLDAHGDIQTLETTASGYLGGLALRLLVGYRPELIADGLGLRPVAEPRVVLAGARDLDPPEITYLADAAITRAEVTGLDAVTLPPGPLYVHADLDVIDPPDVPGLRYPAPGGPRAAQVAEALRLLAATGQVAAMGIACTWHPGRSAAASVDSYLKTALALPD